MGNINICKGNEFRSSLGHNKSKQVYQNQLIQEVELDSVNINIQLYSGYCAMEKSDVTVNISDEIISRSSNNQEIMLFSRAGEELRKETAEYISKHRQLHYKLPFYTHAGDLQVSNVIHCTLSENKRTISENQITQAFIECLQIADEELEASTISFPMIQLRSYSLPRISHIMVRAIKQYLKKAKKNRNQHLQVIKIIGDEPRIYKAYMNTIQDEFTDVVKTFCENRKLSQQLDQNFERPYSCEDRESYIPSYKSDNTLILHYQKSQEIDS